MARTYTSTLKHLERVHEPIWRAIRDGHVLQTKWIKHLRWGLNMSARQLGKRMGISAQAARNIEQRELDGTVTIATLRRAAQALDMDLFYTFVPKQGRPIENALMSMVEERAEAIAKEIVARTVRTMSLEDQATTQAAVEENVKAIANELVVKQHGSLWD